MVDRTVLVVEDDKLERLTLVEQLRDEGYHVLSAAGATEAWAQFQVYKSEIDVVLTDLRMPGMDGMELLQKIKERSPDTQVILLTAYASIESAVGAMKAGAHDYLSKPYRYEELAHKLKRVVAFRDQLREIAFLRGALRGRYAFQNIIGRSPPMQRVFDRIQALAADQCIVLIQGETGTGKELVAKAIHYNSPRQSAPFVAVNCAALSREVIESELFGHERGAFTGALRRHKGRFELAQGGTLFLDELDEIPLDIQVKLLRVIEEKELMRVGGERPIKVDARLVSATKRDLGEMVSEGTFRTDLYYRLEVAKIQLPPLVERREDIPLLVDHFLEEMCKARKISTKRVSAEAMRAFLEHDWPGNVRELENVVEQAVLLAPAGTIEQGDLPARLREERRKNALFRLNLTEREQIDLTALLKQVEEETVFWALSKAGGNQAKAAKLLGIPRTTLRHRLAKNLPLRSLSPPSEWPR